MVPLKLLQEVFLVGGKKCKKKESFQNKTNCQMSGKVLIVLCGLKTFSKIDWRCPFWDQELDFVRSHQQVHRREFLSVLRSRIIFTRLRLGKIFDAAPAPTHCIASVAEPVQFCAAPAPAFQKFRLRLQLVKNFGSGSDHFPHIFSKKIKNFHGLKKMSGFLKPKKVL
jgi:hypothetical protein